MTDNIQKLYEIAGVKKKYCGWLDMGDLDTQYEYVMCDTLEEYKETAEFSRTSYSSDDDNYMTPEIKYPPFTAEKQLELIKWVTKKTYRNYFKLLYSFGQKSWYMESDCISTPNMKNFENTLAGLVCKLWENLSDDQKQEIKEILQ